MTRLDESLIAIPPSMDKHIDFLLQYHILWWAKDRFKGKTRLLPEHYAAFKKLVAGFGEDIPSGPYRLPMQFSVTKIPVSAKGMPANYQHLTPTTDCIWFVLDWRPSRNHGGYRPQRNILSIYPNSIDYLVNYPSKRNDPDDLKIALSLMKETISHELRHMVQYVFLNQPDQIKQNPGYEKHKTEYMKSPVEFDPSIGSAVEEFMNLWNLYGSSSRKIELATAIKRFVGAEPSPTFSTFTVNPFFKVLKQEAPARYRIAVKKFVHELRSELAA